ncbi:MAG: T9SS type A sorting domain-containing protein, partial [Ignavibacterium sp.]
GNNVTLNWSTATETNNQGFEIQRSNGGEYEVVGYVAGHGTTVQPHSYSYIDQNVGSGRYQYRLRQIDLDGKYEYSSVVEVEVLGPKEFSLAQNYPNPFNPSTSIDFALAVDSRVTLKVFDVLGQEVMTLINGNYTAGSHKVNFDASGLNSGVYVYRIDATGNDGKTFSASRKMILNK